MSSFSNSQLEKITELKRTKDYGILSMNRVMDKLDIKNRGDIINAEKTYRGKVLEQKKKIINEETEQLKAIIKQKMNNLEDEYREELRIKYGTEESIIEKLLIKDTVVKHSRLLRIDDEALDIMDKVKVYVLTHYNIYDDEHIETIETEREGTLLGMVLELTDRVKEVEDRNNLLTEAMKNNISSINSKKIDIMDKIKVCILSHYKNGDNDMNIVDIKTTINKYLSPEKISYKLLIDCLNELDYINFSVGDHYIVSGIELNTQT